MLDPDRLLERLNPPQREAVTHGTGPLLILAGAGSGKTRVITSRIAWLVGAHGANPRTIVAMTFTNKAAAEMRERAERWLGHELAGAFVGTFHSFGLRLLRIHAEAAGLETGFVVYDTTDQVAIVREAVKAIGMEERTLPPRQILSAISRHKNALVTPEVAAARARGPHEALSAACYEQYEQALRRAGAVDFDDLLVYPVRLFTRRPEILEKYARRIEWLLVDEYQDTNPLQYALVRQLTTVHRNVCCVGDEDQSIYGFRGADIRNILDFTRDYPEATIVKLEQNYRSTGTILAAAATLIARNLHRHEKTLWTDGDAGEKLTVRVARDDRAEADFIIAEMLRRAREDGVPLEEIAVLYRTNALSRLIEDRLVAANVPYRVIGSLRFYDRKEIKDLLAWLRLLVHADSDQDFVRAAGTPPRGIGDRTLDDLGTRAASVGASLYRAAETTVADPASWTPRTQRVVTEFLETLRDLATLSRGVSTVATIQAVIDTTDYMGYLEKAYPSDAAARQENVGALLAAAREHDEGGAPDGLGGFLDRVSLRSDSDDVHGSRGPSLMTVHSAKGLEFDGVIVAGLNENVFPHVLSGEDPDEIEEERRLMYVALTRARRFLVLTLAHERSPFGRPLPASPSRFLAELPQELLRNSAEDARYAGPARGGFNRFGVRDWGKRAEPATPAAGTARGRGERRVEREPENDQAAYRPGMVVVHPMFGPGRVLSVEGEGERVKLQIRFERAGLKRIMAKQAMLTPG